MTGGRRSEDQGKGQLSCCLIGTNLMEKNRLITKEIKKENQEWLSSSNVKVRVISVTPYSHIYLS